jgi:hypothetical protein
MQNKNKMNYTPYFEEREQQENQYKEQEQQAQNQSQPQNSQQYDRLIQEEKVNNFIGQTSPSKSLNEINFMLQGFIYNPANRQWEKISKGLPEHIRMDFIQALAPHLTENVRMTRLDRNQINGIMDFLIEWVADYLDLKADDENLSEEQMTKIGLIMLSAAFYVLARAENGMEREKMYNALKLGDSFSDYAKMQDDKKGGFLSSILPWK